MVHSSVSCCALPMGLLSFANYAGDSRLLLHAESNTQAHTGRGEKVTRRIWEGSKCVSFPHPNEQGATELLSAGLGTTLRTDVSPQFQWPP